MKYIFVSGGVISGIGKGVTSASIAMLLKASGYRVAPIKFENYLNLDAGTINPIEHGDPLLCEDGTEADMDIGTYEKFLDEDMGKSNFVTMGQIYQEVIDRERRFEYNGEDVEAIPYITDEITKRINNAGRIKKADIVIIELGGTAGEYQNVFYYEASRIMTLQNPGDVVHIHVSYVPTPPHLGEPKTKPTELSSWEKLVEKINAKKEKNIEIAIVGKYFGTGDYQLKDSYAALFDAIDHAAFSIGVGVKTKWIDAEKVEKMGVEIIGKPDGLIVPIGWGERGAEGMIAAASYARKNNIPYLGLCYGMQLAVIAFARDILGWFDANTNENNIKTKHPVIHLMPAQKKYMEKRAYGGTMRLGTWDAKVKKETKAFEIYGMENTSERH